MGRENSSEPPDAQEGSKVGQTNKTRNAMKQQRRITQRALNSREPHRTHWQILASSFRLYQAMWNEQLSNKLMVNNKHAKESWS
jgi:hypothetical protein